LPEELGASRENHLVRSSAVIDSIRYGAGQIEYSTFDALPETMEVLRLSFVPKQVTANGRALRPRRDLLANGYTIRKLSNGDTIVQIRHDGAKQVTVAGKDPQGVVDDNALNYDNAWASEQDASALGRTLRVAETKDATMAVAFEGNQVRLLGRADEFGGEADVFVDGVKELVPIDCWNPSPRSQQVLYYKNGLSPGTHALEVIARGTKNPYSKGSRISLNGREVVRNLNVAATAGGSNQAVDLVFNDVAPENGVLVIRFASVRVAVGDQAMRGEAFVQAIEVGPGSGGRGAKPVSSAAASRAWSGNLLLNPGFEETRDGILAQKRGHDIRNEWTTELTGSTIGFLRPLAMR
jgi:hypothetical protein